MNVPGHDPAQEQQKSEVVVMQAAVGDRIIVKGHHIGEPDRDAEVLEVGPNGGPPYRVRWGDSGHEGLYFPGTDAWVQHFEHASGGAEE